jgi:membrane protease YdiL (CAAX protease family)
MTYFNRQTFNKEINTQQINNNCIYNELFKYDANKPMSSFSNQLITALVIIILNNLILQVVIKYYPQEKLIIRKQNIETVLSEETKSEFKKYSKKLVSPNILLLSEVVNASLYAPIIEEVFFRFLLLKLLLVRYFKLNIHTAIIIHAILFGSFHMTNVITSDQEINKTVIQSVSAGLSGVIYAYAYIYTNSIFTPLLAHFINNIMSTMADYIEYSKYYVNIVKK